MIPELFSHMNLKTQSRPFTHVAHNRRLFVCGNSQFDLGDGRRLQSMHEARPAKNNAVEK